VFRQVLRTLPEHTTLGEIVDAATQTAHMSPVLGFFTVQELIEIAKERPVPPAPRRRRAADDDADPASGSGGDAASVIRRRADAPDGDLRVLKCASVAGGARETDLATATGLTADQARLILRQLRARGLVHAEGTGPKRRLKLTRQGASYLRKLERGDAV
jgi:predicted transcriptional regulator